ncbi:MAG: UDP-N-acetylmuramoyl-L-alanyl-D-glutamate--2,6-diaminopimelate ligase, partial [Alphaproteobacteria bacterium]|nr:UDP-N-acetylmuramoyl-L-alanyl-D-glutamate--2,6-diaminopimelate ligase [Alphaproteobacteria bacterium]
MRLSELLDAELNQPGFDTIEIKGLTLDSRQVEPGFAFAALAGVKVHGRQFAALAVEKGAVAIVSDAAIDGLDVPVIISDDPSALLARMARRFYPGQPAHVVAVTGTNGKSSTVDFLRQIWEAAGLEGASLGTLGVARKGETITTGYTTPDSIALHRALHRLHEEGITHLAMEASSHGLKQRRMEAVDLAIAGFTNLTQDHLDYHPDFEDYFHSKARLFTERLPADGTAIINVDSSWGEQIADMCRVRGVTVITVGWRGGDMQICEVVPRPASQDITIKWRGVEYQIEVPFVGEFQVLNAVGAAAIALHEGLSEDQVFGALAKLEGVPGRLEKVGETAEHAPVLVDYAHTPDGLD